MHVDSSICFSELSVEVPKWLKDFDILSESIEGWKLSHPIEQTTPQSKQPRVSSSADSLRPVDYDDTNRFSPMSRRDRPGQAAAIPGMASRMTVVHYDSGIQKQMEALVRAITSGQSWIRKAKMAARVSGYMDPRADSISGWPPLGHSGTRRKRTNSNQCRDEMTNQKEDTTIAALEELETALTDSQMLCEHAAHQVLRDGDCGDNLELMKKCFLETIHICEREMNKLSEQIDVHDEQLGAKKQRCEDSVNVISTSGPFKQDMALHILDVDEDDSEGDSEQYSSFVMPRQRLAGLPRMMAH